MKLPSILRPVSVALLLATASSVLLAQPSPPPVPTTTESQFRCDGTSTQACTFVLYSSNCEESAVKNGRPTLVCTHAFLQQFTLPVGQSKKVSGLPANFKQCVIRPGVKAAFPECAK
ncbi:MAG: hypothetical protein PHS32_04900 [Rhodoferax sp.]|uniref:hypothetical protein n=1 Tax=Rhodoferax sp. TaxID=50421 RepID=UPI0026199BA3|nr:hypothetical protein [Rhodoferax sp.]MDD5333066.1 hypothetical protein [Rhodoferax sp.]